jgi:hypothetical protein
MNHPMLRPGNGLILLFLVFVCVPTFVRTKDSKPAPKAPSRGNTGGACTEGVANLVGDTVSGTIRFLKQGASGTKVQIEVKGLKRGESSNFHSKYFNAFNFLVKRYSTMFFFLSEIKSTKSQPVLMAKIAQQLGNILEQTVNRYVLVEPQIKANVKLV